jgi:hypothetical protein
MESRENAMNLICGGCGNTIEAEDAGLCATCAGELMRQKLSYQLRPHITDKEESIMHIETQKKKILRHMETFGSIDPVQALQEYGVFRLAARIEELRQEYVIDTHLVKTVNRFGEEVRYGRYVLVRKAA